MKKINLILFFVLIMLIGGIVSADLQVYRNIKNTIGYMSKMIFTVDGTLGTPVKVSIDGLTGNISLSGDLRIGNNICLGGVCNSSFDSLWSLNGSNVSYNGGNVGIGIASPGYKLHVIGDTYITGGRLRVAGTKGLYFNDYSAGLYMEDVSWIKTTGNQSLWTNNGLLGANGGLTVGYNGLIGGTANGGASIAGNVGIGISSPAYKLDVVGLINSSSGICMNGDCKTSWSQVAGGSSVGVYQFTGTSATCDSTSAGKIKYSAGSFYGCDGTTWLQIVSNKKGFFTNPGLSCKDILNNGGSIGDGSYRIQPSGAGSSFQVYCDMTTSGGGRTLIAYGNQRPSSYNLNGLKNLAGSLSYTTSARTNFGTLPYALTITKASTQIAFSYDPTQNKTGNMNAYESYAIATLPTPSSITLDFADPGTCVDVSFVTTKGRTFPNTYKRYSKSLGVISSTRYFFGFTNASLACVSWTNGDEIMFDAGASLDNGWRYANTSYSADGSVGMWVK